MKTKFSAEEFIKKFENIKKEQSVEFLSFESAFEKIEKQLSYAFENNTKISEDYLNKIVVYLGAKTLQPEDKKKLKVIYEDAGFKFRYKEENDGLTPDYKEDKKKYVVYLYY